MRQVSELYIDGRCLHWILKILSIEKIYINDFVAQHKCFSLHFIYIYIYTHTHKPHKIGYYL